MIKRKDVYEAIDSERDYQEKIGEEVGWGAGQGASNHSVGDFLTIIQAYCTRAHEVYVNTVGDKETLNFIRKIAGIAVACMEKHGAPKRKI